MSARPVHAVGLTSAPAAAFRLAKRVCPLAALACWRLVLQGEHTARILADRVGKPMDNRRQGRRR